ncbi:hypothetical protein V9K67_24305 [Paraflavisolibacter sp. H34]|uniref:hypothetical protein n=1 Tax=Huijunlia imazamoxiresistens TaxID=3127457 RepID=UPI00301A5F26
MKSLLPELSVQSTLNLPPVILEKLTDCRPAENTADRLLSGTASELHHRTVETQTDGYVELTVGGNETSKTLRVPVNIRLMYTLTLGKTSGARAVWSTSLS